MDPTTSNIALAVPRHGSNVDMWDVPLNGNSTALDGLIGGVQTIPVSNSNITLTGPSTSITPTGGPTQAQNASLKFTGALTGNVKITLPLPGSIIVHNLTTGNFVVTFAAAASGQVIAVQQGSARRIYNDGTNVFFVDLPDVGSLLDLVTAAVPSWITACTVPPYLNCVGGTFNATTYPYLNAYLGGNTLPDLRGVSRATLNQGTGRITTAGSGIDGNTLLSVGGGQTQTLTAAQIPSIQSLNAAFGVTVSGSAPIPTINASANIGGSGGGTVINNSSTITSSGVVGAGSVVSTSDNTGGGAHPIMQPTTISGITLIRAA
jgi:hypothetical protein